MDIEVGGEAAGRLVFSLDEGATLLPKTVESFRQQITGERTSVSPKLTYKGCQFEYNPTYVMTPGGGAYKYSHICKGRGSNIYGSMPFVEKEAFSACRNTCPGNGGNYYGVKVDLETTDVSSVLAVPIMGPGYGNSRFYIVRVRASASSMKERLLSNTAVLGTLVSGEDVLDIMASGAGQPSIADCGMLE